MDVLHVILLIWCLLAVFTFIVLLFIPAPYGRHSYSFGPKINGTWGWIIMEIPSVLIYPLFFFTGNCLTNLYNITFLSLWELHYVHRTFIYAWRRRQTTRQIPILIIFFGMIFNCFNAFLNSYFINIVNKCSESGPLFFSGVILFILGFLINFTADEQLLALRRQGGLEYKIPSGGLYNYISCPNYLGEIIEWFGFFVATLSPAAFAFFLWTSANLIPRALSHHVWYQNHFPKYPKDRKAIFPFLL